LQEGAEQHGQQQQAQPVNNKGGNSCSASFEVMKLPAQASAYQRNQEQVAAAQAMDEFSSRMPMALVELAQGPQWPDQQETRSVKKLGRWPSTLWPMNWPIQATTNTAIDGGHQRAHAEARGDPAIEEGAGQETDEQAHRHVGATGASSKPRQEHHQRATAPGLNKPPGTGTAQSSAVTTRGWPARRPHGSSGWCVAVVAGILVEQIVDLAHGEGSVVRLVNADIG
jgi:hypothetical protein